MGLGGQQRMDEEAQRVEFNGQVPIASMGHRGMVWAMPETIEAEVIEIDGVTPPEGHQAEPEGPGPSGGRRMQIPVIRLDRRWWPLWLVLGILAVALMATVGVVVGAVYLVYRVVRGLFQALFGGGAVNLNR